MASVRTPAKERLQNLDSPGDSSAWTYGCEFEFSDWDRTKYLGGFVLDEQDFTMVNSNGIAVDPKGKLWQRGGEVCTQPTEFIDNQGKQLNQFLKLYPETTVNYRSNLHIHVRIPGLRTDIKKLKRILKFNLENLPDILPVIDPIPVPIKFSGSAFRPLEYAGAQRRYRRRKQSHHFISAALGARQLKAKTPCDFFTEGVPQDKNGNPMWGVAQRWAVDMKQLLQTDTIEFRHFSGTLDAEELHASIRWCRDWLQIALGKLAIEPLKLFEVGYGKSGGPLTQFPPFQPYNHDLEVKYRATVHDGSVPREDILKYQQQILNDRFRGSPYYE